MNTKVHIGNILLCPALSYTYHYDVDDRNISKGRFSERKIGQGYFRFLHFDCLNRASQGRRDSIMYSNT